MPTRPARGRVLAACGALLLVTGLSSWSVPDTATAAVNCSAFRQPVYDRINPSSRAQLLTPYRSEADKAVATYAYTSNRGAPFRASAKPGSGLAGVHRLYRSSTRHFFYSTNRAEIARATSKLGYVDQGVRFYAATSAASCLRPVTDYYRAGVHRFTTSTAEGKALAAAGWRKGFTRFYVAPPPAPSPPAPPAGTDTSFSIAIVPDTQQEVVRSGDPRFGNRTQWLAANRRSLDLRFVSHVGDVVNWGWLVPSQYAVASNAMKPLEQAKIPYALAIGNHDTRAVGWSGTGRQYGGSAYVGNPECRERLGAAQCNTNLLVRRTDEFNATFSAQRYGRVAGAYERGKVDNIYSTFDAGGAKWMVLTLELWPRTQVVNWARSVVAAHPRHNVIVQTHAYLEGNGSISRSNGGYGANSPQYLFDNLIKVYPNIRMVSSGHTGRAASRIDRGTKGNRIYSFLTTFHDPHTNPVRVVTIDTKANTLRSRIYAPYTRQSYPAYDTSATSVSWVR